MSIEQIMGSHSFICTATQFLYSLCNTSSLSDVSIKKCRIQPISAIIDNFLTKGVKYLISCRDEKQFIYLNPGFHPREVKEPMHYRHWQQAFEKRQDIYAATETVFPTSGL